MRWSAPRARPTRPPRSARSAPSRWWSTCSTPRPLRARSRRRRRRRSFISSPISLSRPARRNTRKALRAMRVCASRARAIWLPPRAPPTSTRMIAQSIAFHLCAGRGRARRERSAQRRSRDGRRPSTAVEVAGRRGAVAAGRRRAALRLFLRPGHLVRAGQAAPSRRCMSMPRPSRRCSRSTRAKPGVYNIAEDDGAVSSEKAKRDFGFDAGFRIKP